MTPTPCQEKKRHPPSFCFCNNFGQKSADFSNVRKDNFPAIGLSCIQTFALHKHFKTTTRKRLQNESFCFSLKNCCRILAENDFSRSYCRNVSVRLATFHPSGLTIFWRMLFYLKKVLKSTDFWCLTELIEAQEGRRFSRQKRVVPKYDLFI